MTKANEAEIHENLINYSIYPFLAKLAKETRKKKKKQRRHEQIDLKIEKQFYSYYLNKIQFVQKYGINVV